MERIEVAELHKRFKAQGVSNREHIAVKCPICGTVQSLTSFERAGVEKEDRERSVGYSCIGRFTNAGPWKKDEPPGRGCDWTLGGLFRLHKLEVINDDGKALSFFEVATPEEALALETRHAAAAAA